MKLLAIETSGNNCSVALSDAEKAWLRGEDNIRAQSQLLLKFVDAALNEAKIKLNQLDALVYSFGPGGFTGVRLAASIVQGLALKDNLPVIPISSLQALAQKTYQEYGAKTVAVCVDAHMDEVYFNVYHLTSQGIMQSEQTDQLLSPNHLPAFVADWAVGNGWLRYPDALHSLNDIKQDVNLLNDATTLISLARYYFPLGHAVRAEEALPNYLRNQNAWRKTDSSLN